MSRQLVNQSDHSIGQESGDVAVAAAADRKLERKKKRRVKRERERQEREMEKEGQLERDRTSSSREKTFDLHPITDPSRLASFVSQAGKMGLEPTNHTTLLSHVMPVQSQQKPLPAMSQSRVTSHMISHMNDHVESKSKFGRDTCTRPRPGELSLG